jgi:hypothetical protein
VADGGGLAAADGDGLRVEVAAGPDVPQPATMPMTMAETPARDVIAPARTPVAMTATPPRW